LAAALDAGDVAAVQLRLKGADDEAIRNACASLRPIAQDRDVAFLLNDRPDLAADTGCDGVHIGAEDMPYREARKIVGEDAIVGVSCYDSMHLAMVAAEQGADYVAFGAVFPTTTKTPRSRAPISLITDWTASATVPCVAIGGITVANCAEVVHAGADFLAVVAGIWDYPDGAARAVADFNAAIAHALAHSIAIEKAT